MKKRNANMKSSNMKRKQSGFTLLELMLVVTIVAIIMGFAMPSYVAHNLKSKRHQAISSLSELVQAMETDYTINESYRDIVTLNKFADQVPYLGTANYDLTVSIPVAGGYLLSAAPTGTHVDTDCGTLTLSDTGAKTPLECW